MIQTKLTSRTERQLNWIHFSIYLKIVGIIFISNQFKIIKLVDFFHVEYVEGR